VDPVSFETSYYAKRSEAHKVPRRPYKPVSLLVVYTVFLVSSINSMW